MANITRRRTVYGAADENVQMIIGNIRSHMRTDAREINQNLTSPIDSRAARFTAIPNELPASSATTWQTGCTRRIFKAPLRPMENTC